jgi:RNA recognition motif-containing protein
MFGSNVCFSSPLALALPEISGRAALAVIVLAVIMLAIGFLLGRITDANRNETTGKPSRKSERNGAGDELYVGNLPYDVDDGELKKAFRKFGTVTSARVIVNKSNGKSKGFGFVTMENDAQCDAAIKGMHGNDLNGRKLVVNRAK